MNQISQIQQLIGNLTRLCGKDNLDPEAVALRESPIAKSFTPDSIVPRPFKDLPNVSSLWVRTNRLDPLLAKHGVTKKLEPEMAFEALSWRIKACNRYIRIMHYRLEKLLLNRDVAGFWVLALQLMQKSKVLRAVALRKWDPNWHRNYKFGLIKKILNQLDSMIRNLQDYNFIVRNYVSKVKADGTKTFRPIGNPHYPDRMYLFLWQSFITMFVSQYISKSQHAYVPGRGVPTALTELRQLMRNKKYKFAWEFDLKGAFPSVKLHAATASFATIGFPKLITDYLLKVSIRTVERVDLSPPDQYRLLDEPKFDRQQEIARHQMMHSPAQIKSLQVEKLQAMGMELMKQVMMANAMGSKEPVTLLDLPEDHPDYSPECAFDTKKVFGKPIDVIPRVDSSFDEFDMGPKGPHMDLQLESLEAHVESDSERGFTNIESQGFPQGSGVSPILFNLTFEYSALRNHFSLLHPSVRVISYADDFLVFSEVDLPSIWDESPIMKEHGLTISREKSREIKVNGTWTVDKVKYLGVTFHLTDPVLVEGTPRSGAKLQFTKANMIDQFNYRDSQLAKFAKALDSDSPASPESIIDAWGRGERPYDLLPLEVMEGRARLDSKTIKAILQASSDSLDDDLPSPAASSAPSLPGNTGSSPFEVEPGTNKLTLKGAREFFNTRIRGLVINRLHGGSWTPLQESANRSLRSPVKTEGRSWLELKTSTAMTLLPKFSSLPTRTKEALVDNPRIIAAAREASERDPGFHPKDFLDSLSIYTSTSHATVDCLKLLKNPNNIKIANGLILSA